jgi:hypothetical protein
MNAQKIFSSISEPQFNSMMVAREQSSEDIAEYMLKAEKQSRKYVHQIAPFFKAPTLYETCQRIFYFLKKHVPYQREPAEKQTAKTINRIMDDARNKRGNDCKHYATFAVSILNYFGVPCAFRLVSFSENNNPTHAYAIAKEGKNIFIIDPCLDYFDKETNYKRRFDVKPLN